MSQSKYAHAAIQNMIKSPEDRWKTASRLVEAAGGTRLQFHITYGEYDLFIIAHTPAAESSAPVLLAAASAGRVSNLTTALAMTTSDGKAEFETARTVGNKFKPETGGS